jgi:hypothetical protein
MARRPRHTRRELERGLFDPLEQRRKERNLDRRDTLAAPPGEKQGNCDGPSNRKDRKDFSKMTVHELQL